MIVASKFSKIALPYRDRRVWVMVVLGFFSGLPLLLTGSTMTFWLSTEGLNLKTAALFSLVALPYPLKFFWAPLVDRLKIPYLTNFFGRRRSWMLLAQTLLAAGLFYMGTLSPHENKVLIALTAFIIAFSSATLTIVLFGYQFERLGPTQYGAGEATFVFGYRLGMLMAGAGALYLASSMTWGAVYQIMSLLSVGGLIFTLCIREPTPKPNHEALQREKNMQKYLHSHPKLSSRQAHFLAWGYAAIICPFSDFIRRNKGWFLCLALMFFYRLGDNLIGNMSAIFYSEWGFTNTEIAQASKTFGMAATIFGGFIGGILATRWGMMRCLFYCCLLHAIATLAYLYVYYQGNDLAALYLSIALENITGGMRVTALFAYQLTLCSSTYAATQLSLLSSLIEFGRTTCSAISGWLVTFLGWHSFFLLATVASFPALLIIFLLARTRGDTLSFKKIPSQSPLKTVHYS